MNTRTKPLISLCMIVGNVEEYIERCLESFAPIADQIVVVRAIGNQDPDRTLDIAREKFGAITCDYLNDQADRDKAGWPHVDSFAAARQKSYDLATGDYCFWCDSDDILEPGAAALIRQHAEAGEFECFIFPYNIFGRGVVVPRERMMRRGAGKWRYPVHECFVFDNQIEAAQDDRVVITHLPHVTKSGSNERNLRILERMDRAEMHPGLLYHLTGEFICARRLEEAKEVAKLALSKPELGKPERYEIYLNLARMSGHPQVQEGYLNLAYQADPCRREALGMLACVAMDYGKRDEALAFARQMMATEPPRNESWNDRRDAYGWLGADILQQALRVNGRFEDAEKLRQQVLTHGGGAAITLIHATRGRRIQAALARKQWLDLAEFPERIEHIFVIDEDDAESDGLRRMHHVVIPPGGGCVAAWNAGASVAGGQVFLQMSDDWTPPPKWDSLILERIGDLSKPSVLAVSDGHRTDRLLCMAICTREYWGLDHFFFHPGFTGVFSDDWFTEQAYERGAVIEARDLVFTHHHPAFGAGEWDPTYQQQNSNQAYRFGQAHLEYLRSGRDWSSCEGWFDFHPFYDAVANLLPDKGSFVEVGVWKGRSIIYLAQRLQALGKDVQLVAVDNFHGDADCGMPGNFHEEFIDNCERCGCRKCILPVAADSALAACNFLDATLDGVFLDAGHDYDSVKADIAAWLPKVKPGGIFAGHDIDAPGVLQAVKEAGFEFETIGRVWMKKP